jgi:hypothetical protein
MRIGGESVEGIVSIALVEVQVLSAASFFFVL